MTVQSWMLFKCIFLLALLYSVSSKEKPYDLPEDYDKNDVPPGDNGPLLVEVTLDAFSVDNVLEKERQMLTDLMLTFTWMDKRVNITCKNCEDAAFSLSSEEANRFWRIHFATFETKRLLLARGDVQTTVNFIHGNNKFMYMVPMLLYSVCDFHFSMYPFDIQRCAISFFAGGPRTNELMLQWSPETNMKQRRYILPLFCVDMCLVAKPIEVPVTPTESIAVLRIVLILHRQLKTQLLQVYLPSFILVVVSWGGFVISVEVVPGRMVLLVTSLLSLMTLLGTTRHDLPPSLQVKCMEVWILSCIVFVFFALFEFAILLFLSRRKEERKEHQMNHQKYLKAIRKNEHPDIFSVYSTSAYKTIKRRGWRRCCLFSSSHTWNTLDKISLILFPAMFIAFNGAYWYLYLKETAETFDKFVAIDDGCFRDITYH